MDILFSLSDLTGLTVTMLGAFIAAILLGTISGILGSFIVLRRLSLMGDALSHAVLPGVALSYMLGINILIGATLSGILGAVLIQFIIKHSNLKTDASIGIILSSFFALGIVLITKAESSVDLNHILFGNILAVTPHELIQSFVLLLIVVLVVKLFFKELLITSFDPVMSRAYGLKNNFYHYLLMILLTLFTISALAQVGIVLVVAMLIIPASTAYLWVNTLPRMIIMSSILGILFGILGVILSFHYDLPTSATIVIVGALAFALSFFLSPRNGFLHYTKKGTSL